MPLLNSQYDALMRQYDETRERYRHELEAREEEIDTRIPEYRALTDKVSSLSLEAARIRIFDPGADISSYTYELARIAKKKAELLEKYGYPADYLEMKYSCSLCRDTGFVNGRRCTCFKKAATGLLYKEYDLNDVLEKENFSHFSFDWYSDTIQDESSGLTERQFAREAFDKAHSFINNIGKPDNNLFIYGNTGVGKTFLTHCIAREVIEGTHSALYFSARDFFQILADIAFSREGRDGSYERMILDIDFLTIDDLGTEVTNSFVSSQLFFVLSERIRKNRSTIISTNISPLDLSRQYSERIFSRIISHYDMVKLVGKDIRLQQKLHGGNA